MNEEYKEYKGAYSPNHAMEVYRHTTMDENGTVFLVDLIRGIEKVVPFTIKLPQDIKTY